MDFESSESEESSLPALRAICASRRHSWCAKAEDEPAEERTWSVEELALGRCDSASFCSALGRTLIRFRNWAEQDRQRSLQGGVILKLQRRTFFYCLCQASAKGLNSWNRHRRHVAYLSPAIRGIQAMTCELPSRPIASIVPLYEAGYE